MLRGDFHYWVPLDGALGLIVTVTFRVATKTITDYTGVVQMRHPGEMGGLYWTLNMVLALAASCASVFVYFEYGELEVVEEQVAWSIVGGLVVIWVVTFGLFLVLMKKEYRGTFWSVQLGKQLTMDYFSKGQGDATKAIVLNKNKLQWREIREDVKEWVQGGWWRWKEDKPAFYTEKFIASVPLDMIPEEGQHEAMVVRTSMRRRSSLGPIQIV